MAAPVILYDQGALGGLTFREYFFQPAAMNAPTAWTTAGTTLPPGLTLDTATGLISGVPTTVGTGYFALQASNADGLSAAVLFAIGIESAPPIPPAGYIAVTIELSNGAVTYEGAESLSVKSGDDLLQQIRLTWNGTAVDAPVTSLKYSLKLDEGEDAIVAGNTWVKVGSGEATVYRHATELRGAALDDALERGIQKVPRKELVGTEAAKRITQILVLAEYEIQFANTGLGKVGNNPAVRTSQTVGVEIVRELIPTA